MTLKLVLAFVGSFLVTLLVGSYLVPMLRRIKAGQEIREDGPVWHNSKRGTPTMGGMAFVVASFISLGIASVFLFLKGDRKK